MLALLHCTLGASVLMVNIAKGPVFAALKPFPSAVAADFFQHLCGHGSPLDSHAVHVVLVS